MRMLIPLGLAALLTAGPALAADTRSPEAVALQGALERGCLPLLTGASPDEAARSAGFVRGAPVWRRKLSGAEILTLRAPDMANPHVCTLRLTYPPGQTPALIALLSAWTAARGLAAGKVNVSSRGPALQRQTWTWAGRARAGDMALVFAREQTLDGGLAAKGLEQAEVLLSLSPPGPAA